MLQRVMGGTYGVFVEEDIALAVTELLAVEKEAPPPPEVLERAAGLRKAGPFPGCDKREGLCERVVPDALLKFPECSKWSGTLLQAPQLI